ncbi:MAG: D-alanyl-D-alanine carboxypeptidase [Candidatus Binatia bacterium]
MPRRRAVEFAALLGLSMATLGEPLPATAAGVPLVWHVESGDGKVLDSHEPDSPVNPASVVKLATSLRALETLGVDHRFVTTVGTAGARPSGSSGEVTDIVIEGGADPDFHFENAVLLARTLEEAGVRRASGDLYVGSSFWLGWERGTVGRDTNDERRREDMGRRLLHAWSPRGWNQDERESWKKMAGKRGWNASKPPAIQIDGKIRTAAPPKWEPVVVHRSQPLLVALRRFNVFSNNDIERLDASVGAPSTMPDFFESRWGREGASTSFSTSSGLNRNRMTPRQIVRLVRDLRAWLAGRGRDLGDVMPILGCGESTLPHLFRRFAQTGEANGLVGKTGTLNIQDGGVSALAGYLPVGPGLVFFVAAPRAGQNLGPARAATEDWARRVLLSRGTVQPPVCPPPVPTSDEFAQASRTGAPTTPGG